MKSTQWIIAIPLLLLHGCGFEKHDRVFNNALDSSNGAIIRRGASPSTPYTGQFPLRDNPESYPFSIVLKAGDQNAGGSRFSKGTVCLNASTRTELCKTYSEVKQTQDTFDSDGLKTGTVTLKDYIMSPAIQPFIGAYRQRQYQENLLLIANVSYDEYAQSSLFYLAVFDNNLNPTEVYQANCSGQPSKNYLDFYVTGSFLGGVQQHAYCLLKKDVTNEK